jgi:hypothetical protein
MGGLGSGRLRTINRGATENFPGLDIRRLRRHGYVSSGLRAGGAWRQRGPAGPIGEILFEVNTVDETPGWVTVEFTERGEWKAQRLELATVPCRYGGARYFFVCPLYGRRSEVVYLVEGEWASREAHRLSYACQTADLQWSLWRRYYRAKARLDGKGGRPIPRGENRDRLLLRSMEAERQAVDHFMEHSAGRFGLAF